MAVPTQHVASEHGTSAWLWSRAEDVIEAYLATRGKADFARSVKSMTDQTVHEYGGRFLLELVQNGYDAHPADRTDGQVTLLLDRTEGEHGVLYVGNGGLGFTESNVRAISNLGLSDKTIGEGIGNKGVGFKSVLQVCADPEIYSQAAPGEAGFCFRFGRATDVLELVRGDQDLADDVLDNVSLYNLTIPIPDVPPTVDKMWTAGHATVLRLPLRSPAAAELTRDKLDELTQDDVPVMLFLRRLDTLTVTDSSASGFDETVLTRRAAPVVGAEHVRGQEVTLNDNERYYVFTSDVDRHELGSAIETAVQQERLNSRWLDWQAPASVSIAVGLDEDCAQHRYYTYLPLGAKASAPFAGHLNAPFFTNFARLDIDLEHPLNALLLRHAARLALTSATALRELDPDEAPSAVVDLISWDSDLLPHLQQAASDLGSDLTDLPFIPTGSAPPWASMRQVWRWPHPGAHVLTGALASKVCDVALLAPHLRPSAVQRLEATMSAVGTSLTPPGANLATWTEQLMEACRQTNLSLPEWDLAYDDLTVLFADDPQQLTGRKILLTDDLQLRACGRKAADDGPRSEVPFFPPVRQRIDDEDEVDPDADLNLPSSLQQRMFYLHAGLRWHDDNRQQTRAREFLQKHRLVRRFDTRSVLEHLRTVLQSTRSKRTHADALRFVYNLTRVKTPANVALQELGLQVMTAEGAWIPAERALFTSAWTTTRGADVSLLAATPASVSDELAALRSRLLAPPDLLLRTTDDTTAWTVFLRRIGVTDLLPVQTATQQRFLYGRQLIGTVIAADVTLPAAVRDIWQPELPSRYSARYPDTPYRAQSPIVWLPGQGDYAQLGHKARAAIARQIIAGLRSWPQEHLTTTWHRDRDGDKDPIVLPTPLSAFLSQTDWIPVHHPGNPDDVWTVAADSWYHPIRGADVAPRFTPLVSKPLRDVVDDDPVAVTRLSVAGVGMWTQPSHAPQLLRHLGRLLAEGAVRDSQLAQFTKTYRQAWASVAQHRLANVYPASSTCHLVVDRGGAVTALDVQQVAEQRITIVVADRDDDPTLLRLISEFGEALLRLDSSADDVAAILTQRLGELVQRPHALQPAVITDGHDFQPHTDAPRLLDAVPWLRLLVATVLEFRSGAFVHSGERAFQETLDRLRRVRIHRADEVGVRLAGQRQSLPARMRKVFPVSDPQTPTLIIEASDDTYDWSLLEALAEPLLSLLGRTALTAELTLALLRLKTSGAAVADELGYDELADACQVTRHEVEQTASRLATATTPLLERLHPVLAHLLDHDTARTFDPDSSELSSEEEILTALGRLDSLGQDAADLLGHVHQAASLDELRKSLGLELAGFNQTLTELGGRYQPLDYAAAHAEELGLYVRENWPQLSQRLRWARLPQHQRYKSQTDWARLHRPAAFTPDPAWALSRDYLEPAVMAAHLEEELTRMLGEPAPADGPALGPVDTVRRTNSDLVGSVAARLVELVRAWTGRHVKQVPAAFSSDEPAVALRQLLDDAGALDFTSLAEIELLTWLQHLGAWPEGMELSTDLDKLGLSPGDLDAQQSAAAQERAARERARRTIELDGETFDLSSGLADLREALDASLAATPDFLTASNRITRLEALSQRSAAGGATRTPGGPVRAAQHLSDPQKLAIGFAGEWLVYQWLQLRPGMANTDQCWVSGYRSVVFPGEGDDSLGYDFLVPARGGDVMYEVKTTPGPAGELQLGESQVREAQLHARNRRWRLVVVEHALSDQRRMLHLPNPFSPASRSLYSFVGQGLKLRFRPDGGHQR